MHEAGWIGIYNRGLWRLRDDVAAVTGLAPARRFVTARGVDAVAGWGHKPTARHARTIARRKGLPYFALEDGFICARPPGSSQPSLSYVCDPVGIYYDAAAPSWLEALIAARAHDPAAAAADAAMVRAAIGERGVTKYTVPDAGPATLDLSAAPAVIVVDQTVGDAAVTGAGADAGTFAAMLVAAVTENPDRRILVKTHPETRMGRRPGYFTAGGLARVRAASAAVDAACGSRRLVVLDAPVTPRDLGPAIFRAYAVSSLLGMELMLLGVPVTVFGQSFYAGWGLTDDRALPTGRRHPVPLDCLVAAVYHDYPVYLSPHDRQPFPAGEALLWVANPP